MMSRQGHRELQELVAESPPEEKEAEARNTAQKNTARLGERRGTQRCGAHREGESMSGGGTGAACQGLISLHAAGVRG